MFEVITSEASYLKSLNVLIRHFVQSPKFAGTIPGDTSHTGAVISKRDFRVLFSDIIAVCISFLCTTIFHRIICLRGIFHKFMMIFTFSIFRCDNAPKSF